MPWTSAAGLGRRPRVRPGVPPAARGASSPVATGSSPLMGRIMSTRLESVPAPVGVLAGGGTGRGPMGAGLQGPPLHGRRRLRHRPLPRRPRRDTSRGPFSPPTTGALSPSRPDSGWWPRRRVRSRGCPSPSPGPSPVRCGPRPRSPMSTRHAPRPRCLAGAPCRPLLPVGPPSAQRRFAFARGSVADIATVRHALGGTFNDVALAAVTAGSDGCCCPGASCRPLTRYER